MISNEMFLLSNKINNKLNNRIPKIAVKENKDFGYYEITFLGETLIYEYNYYKTLEDNYYDLKLRLLQIIFK